MTDDDNIDGLDSTRIDPDSIETTGAKIGPYKLLRAIGEGGMGTVFMAEQERPVRRRVALKIIKPGMDTRQVVARFEAERQALAMMDHPHIAQVLDVGTTENGRPYFVMELIKGLPITKFCDDKKLNVQNRLELFLSVCGAVQHAHQKGIIHRDLKPSNILVAENDHQTVPKIIDFGLAKALHQRLTDKTIFTQLGQVVGTLEYMSPEQSKRDSLDVDTRTDIYSLSVLLYELLTGSTPFDRKRLRAAAMDQVVKIIREEEPPKPSLRFITDESSAAVAATRSTDPKKLSSQLRGELDWVVMKGMEKDRDRRYQSATEMSSDIKRYLNNETVFARPPSLLYTFTKFALRNRVVMAAAGVVSIALIGAVVASSIFAISEARQRGIADTEKVKARNAADALADQNMELERSNTHLANALKKVKARERDLLAVTDFQSQVLLVGEPLSMGQHLAKAFREELQAELIRENVPEVESQRLNRALEELLVKVNLTNVAISNIEAKLAAIDKEIRAQFVNRLAIKASLLQSLVQIRTELGQYEGLVDAQQEIVELSQQALGDDHPDTLTSMQWLGRILRVKGLYEQALETHEAILKVQRRKHGERHSLVFDAMNEVALDLRGLERDEEALRILRSTLDGRRALFGPTHRTVFISLNNLTNVLKDLGRLEEALRLAEDSLPLGRIIGEEEPGGLIIVLNNLGSLSRQVGRKKEAVTHFREAFQLARANWGDQNDKTGSVMGNLANALLDLNQVSLFD